MQIGIEVIEFLATCLEIYIGLLFVVAMDMDIRVGKISGNIKKALLITTVSSFVYLYNRYIQVLSLISYTSSIILFILFIWWIFDCPLFSAKNNSALSVPLVYWIWIAILDILCWIYFSHFFPSDSILFLQSGNPYRYLYMFVSKSLLVISYFLFRGKIKDIQPIHLNILFLWWSIFILIIVYSIQHIMLTESLVNIESVIIITFISVVYGASLVVLSIYGSKSAEANRLKTMVINNQLIEKHQREMHDIIEQLQNVYHDVDNHIEMISSLLINGKEAATDEYLSTLRSEVKQIGFLFETGSSALDTALYSKMKVAEKYGITVHVSAESSDILANINSFDMTTVVSNLLDNAIEKTLEMMKIDKQSCTVEITISVKQRIFILNVSNPAMPEDIHRCEHAVSSKQGDFHGIGTKNIRSVVKKYNGALVYSFADDYITATATMFVPFGKHVE